MKVGWYTRTAMFEDAPIVRAEAATIDDRSAVRNIGVVVINHHSAAPVWFPIVIAPAVVSKQSNGNARGESESNPDAQNDSRRRRRNVKARVR